jgi:hypothetical protein
MEENVQTTAPVTARSVGMKFGLYSGLVGLTIFLITVILGQNPFGGWWNWIGVAFSIALMFLAHKNFKENNGDGYMSYGQGLGIGFWMTLISTILSISVMYIYLTFIDGSPMDLFLEEQVAKMEEQGQNEQAIEMAQTWTKKLFWVFALIGSIFWGMIIALILSIFTQKKAPETNF